MNEKLLGVQAFAQVLRLASIEATSGLQKVGLKDIVVYSVVLEMLYQLGNILLQLVFRAFYHRALAKRLLLEKSASDDFEKSILKKLKEGMWSICVRCGCGVLMFWLVSGRV